MNPSRRGLRAVYVAAAILLCCIAVGLRLSIPEGIEDYVSSGFTIPAFRYGLLFALIACGVVLSGEHRPIALAAHLAVFASALWFGLQRVEPIILAYDPLAELIVGYPILATAMGLTTGGTLLLPLKARRWLMPFVSASCGLGLGVSMILESPIDYYSGWFSWAGGLSGMAVVIASIALTDGTQLICPGPWLIIAGRILGSWLIAASLMLVALAIVQERSPESAPTRIEIPNDIDLPRQP